MDGSIWVYIETMMGKNHRYKRTHLCRTVNTIEAYIRKEKYMGNVYGIAIEHFVTTKQNNAAQIFSLLFFLVSARYVIIFYCQCSYCRSMYEKSSNSTKLLVLFLSSVVLSHPGFFL